MEVDFLYYMKFVAVTTFTFIAYRLLVIEKKGKTKDHYSRPAWNFFLKKFYAQNVIEKLKKRKQKILKELKNYENESPKILPNEDSSDSQQIFGADHEGNSILVKFTRRRHRIAEVWLILRVKNGTNYTTFTLPDHPNTKITNATPRVFEGSGLKLECQQPYGKWRLTYTGMMRKGICMESNNNEDENENEIFFVRLNFFWSAASFPSFWPFEWSTKLMATALATEKWRDGKWMNLLSLKDAGGYGQFGACQGQVRIYENNFEAYKTGMLPKIETIELNLPGIRQRRWGPHKTEHLHRTAVILGTIKDGTVIEVGAFSSKYGVTHSQFGNVRAPNGIVLPIDWTDFHLASVGENQEQLPQATIVQITAGSHDLIAVVTFRNHEKIPLSGGNFGERWNAFIVPVDIMCNTIRGYGVAIFWYPNEKHFEIFDEGFSSEIKRIFHRNDIPTVDKQVLSFADKEAQSISVSGGKGSSLAILRIIQETKGEQFYDNRNRNYQVLNALVDQFSSPKAANKLLKSKHLISRDTPNSGRARAGSITKIIFPDPNDMDDAPDFYVPQGFVVSVSAYEEHLKTYLEVRKAIRELESIAYEKIDGDIEEACRRVQKAFSDTCVSQLIKIDIVSRLRQIRELDENARFAVRSSGVTEDGDELSSAGQNQTFLGLKTNDEVFNAIIKCWSSLYSHQSVLYRKQNIQPVVTLMAVVIQKMVDAESAGVLFSRHFLNGDPSVIVITANYGLGESVVSGRSEPDTILVKRNYTSDKVEMLASIVGDKKFAIEMDSEEMTKEVELDDEKRKNSCLSSDIALKLAKMSIVLEKFFGTPRDIEFAVTKDRKIYLLQSRAITALNNYTDFEIANERNSAFMSCQEICSKGNVGEVLVGATSSLSQSITRDVIDNQVEKQMMGGKENLIYPKYFPISQHHILIDAGKLMFAGLPKEIQVMDEAMFLGVFGNNVLAHYPEIESICHHRNIYRGDTNQRMIQFKVFGDCWWNINSYMNKAHQSISEMKTRLSERSLFKHKTSTEVVNLINSEMKNFETIGLSHLATSNNSILYQIIAFLILLFGAKKMTTEHQRDITQILSSIGNIESANVPEMMREIAKSIQNQKKDEEFLQVEPCNGVKWLQKNCTEAFELFQKFIERHGHRGFREFDLMSATWAMQPEKVVEMIQANLKFGVPEVSTKNTGKILDELKTPLGKRAKIFLGKIIPRYHKAVQRREETKSIVINAVNELRKSFIYLSKKMVNEGYLPDKELIYHLTYREIKTVIKTRNSKLINNAIRRQKMHPKLDLLKFEEIMFGVPKPISQTSKNDQVEGDVLVRGLPVCSGIVTARACVIGTFSEIHKLQRGDILVTYSTDIGWSPYFPLLSGICTEIGGLISHGAVVARECNLPCIVGASRATERIKHGEIITLNGDEGLISVAM